MKSFSARDIVIIVVSVSAAMILTPVGVMAAASQITIKDPNSASQVQVDTGKLRVGDGTGALTVDGTVKVTDGSGGMTVNGTLGSQMAPQTNSKGTQGFVTITPANTRELLFAGVGPTKINLTSVILAASGPNPGSVTVRLHAYIRKDSASGDCETLDGFAAGERFAAVVPVGQTINLTFPSTLRWTEYADANDYYCIVAETSNATPAGYTAYVAAYGFKS